MVFTQKPHAPQETETSKPNLTGIPRQMKQSFEQSSGLSFDDVRVHYHSALPSRLGALAYTQGSHVYVAPGQERHLGHELGHVVQQKQGRVQATSKLGGVKLNTSPAMEREADTLCRQAGQGVPQTIQRRQAPSSEVVQMVTYPNIAAMWAGICGNAEAAAEIEQIINQDSVLAELYQDAADHVRFCDFVEQEGTMNITALTDGNYEIGHPSFPAADDIPEQRHFIGALIHELSHAAADRQYQQGVPVNLKTERDQFSNMNLPLPGPESSQDDSYEQQKGVLLGNINRLRAVVASDRTLQNGAPDIYRYFTGRTTNRTNRLDYMERFPYNHYDAVLGEMMFHLQATRLANTSTYRFLHRMLREANDRRHQRRWFGNNRMPYDFSRASWFSWY